MLKKKRVVLLVDDQADFRDLMSFWLKTKGYGVIAASSGKEAIEILKKKSPDIIFLDLNMPEMDGVETLEKIRKFNKDLPVVVISAYVDDQRAKDVLAYNISGIFYKGKNFENALSLLEMALRKHKKLKKE